MRIYQTQNLLKVYEGVVTVSGPPPISPQWAATNLITNLDSRSAGNDLKPLIESGSSNYDSCYKTNW